MTTFTGLLTQLGQKAEERATKVALNYATGKIDLDVATNGLAVVVWTSNVYGVIPGEAACRDLFVALGDGEIQSIDTHARDAERIRKAPKTALSRERTAMIAAGRLTRSEAIDTAQAAFGRGLSSSARVKGWMRGMEPDACRQVPVLDVTEGLQGLTDKKWQASDARRERQSEGIPA